jgi:hypothetical protein
VPASRHSTTVSSLRDEYLHIDNASDVREANLADVGDEMIDYAQSAENCSLFRPISKMKPV